MNPVDGQLSDEEVVRQVYPDATATLTSQGWRVLVDVPNIGVNEIGRTSSGHVPEAEAWAHARAKLEVKAELAVGEFDTWWNSYYAPISDELIRTEGTVEEDIKPHAQAAWNVSKALPPLGDSVDPFMDEARDIVHRYTRSRLTRLIAILLYRKQNLLSLHLQLQEYKIQEQVLLERIELLTKDVNRAVDIGIELAEREKLASQKR
jgi:hypothetical protein